MSEVLPHKRVDTSLCKGDAMKTLSIISQKGGAGKTTLAVHLATAAELSGIPTVLIDLDPQGSASVWAEQRGGTAPDVVSGVPRQLQALIEKARNAGAGLVVLDTPPHADQNALSAARESDLVVIPCRPSVYDLAAIRATIDLCEIAKKPYRVVINAAPPQGSIADEARANLTDSSYMVSETVVCNRAAFSNSAIAGQTAMEYEPRGKAANEVAELFHELATSLDLKVKQLAGKGA